MNSLSVRKEQDTIKKNGWDRLRDLKIQNRNSKDENFNNWNKTVNSRLMKN